MLFNVVRRDDCVGVKRKAWFSVLRAESTDRLIVAEGCESDAPLVRRLSVYLLVLSRLVLPCLALGKLSIRAFPLSVPRQQAWPSIQ